MLRMMVIIGAILCGSAAFGQEAPLDLSTVKEAPEDEGLLVQADSSLPIFTPATLGLEGNFSSADELFTALIKPGRCNKTAPEGIPCAFISVTPSGVREDIKDVLEGLIPVYKVRGKSEIWTITRGYFGAVSLDQLWSLADLNASSSLRHIQPRSLVGYAENEEKCRENRPCLPEENGNFFIRFAKEHQIILPCRLKVWARGGVVAGADYCPGGSATNG
jgi:hypothetical protein